MAHMTTAYSLVKLFQIFAQKLRGTTSCNHPCMVLIPLALYNIATVLPLGLPTCPIAAGITNDTRAPDFLHDQLMISGWFP